MTDRPWRRGLALASALLVGAFPAGSQEIPTEAGPAPGSSATETRLGPLPGSGGSRLGEAPGSGGLPLGGRPGPTAPRIPAEATRPGAESAGPARRGIAAPPLAPITDLPLYGPLALPSEAEDEGPADGLTLDGAIDRLVRANLDLRSRFLELPKAQADVLTAGLRANPILTADVQQVPYGAFSEARPGGPTQYDLNVTHPLDLSHKRRARTVVACRARRVLEAQYQDAVRLEIDALAAAFVDVLAARETVRFARASVAGLAEVRDKTRVLLEQETIAEADFLQVQNQLHAAEIGLADAEEAHRDARRALGVLLEIPPERAEALAVRGSIRDAAPPPPAIDDLVRLALAVRPDLAAFRLGIALAEANVALAQANRLADLYLLYQPYTFQDNSPFGAKSAHSWAAGLTVPLPLYNRNQGNIARARITVEQVRTDLAARQRQVVLEVRKSGREYALTRAAVARIERDLLPSSRRVLETAIRRFELGETDALAYLGAQRASNEFVRQYRDTAVRHRRSMLRLNTAVGQRILP
ncbi:MAG TPA: TolC family protein [Isosphaeraceae bacterium]|jgi:cobalt-zinc-cadmium efflux system outer membrane protein